MATEDDSVKRARSPSFPYIGLQKAVEQTAALLRGARQNRVLLSNAAKDWGLKHTSSSTLRTAAALAAFGLIEDSGSGTERRVMVTDLGRRIVEDTRPGVYDKLIREAALHPPLFAEYAVAWAEGRPSDAHAVAELTIDKSFTEDGARHFLRVFDETMELIKLSDWEAPPPPASEESDSDAEKSTKEPPHTKWDNDPMAEWWHGKGPRPASPPPKADQDRREGLMAGERELLTGMLSKQASFRVVVNGIVGPKEIDTLIKKLTIDKEVLADESSEGGEPSKAGVFG